MNNRITRRRLLQSGSWGAVAALAAGCAAAPYPLVSSAGAAVTANLPRSAPKRPPLKGPLRATLPIPDAPLEVKIGQMIMLGFRGQYLAEGSMIMRAIRELHVGSVVLFRYNVQSPAQVTALTATLQAAAEHPLLVAVDHEGGLVNRFTGGFGIVTNYSAQELGARHDLEATRVQGENVAARLAAMGINLNLAPVVDLNLNPANPVIGGVQRSFSADADVVTAHARAMIESHHRHNVLCTLKHFPGHGSSAHDSHWGFVDVTETWQAGELDPYRSLIGATLCDAVMTAHIFNERLDPDYPATLSQPIITGILRQQLGYEGVVISDDMQMRAISQVYDFETAVRQAVLAGVDIIAIANNLAYAENWAERTVRILHRLVEEGVVSPARIDESYRRVMRLKARLAPRLPGDVA
ncbi:MAG: glycoside hydrolase family 3 [Caldilineaceae bacterium]|nr:glycoside hydrolase family 3 [Caldilineaceae bacterium]